MEAGRCSIRIGRDPWAVALEGEAGRALWPAQHAWWLERRAAGMRKFA
jgi:hypothetical protein